MQPFKSHPFATAIFLIADCYIALKYDTLTAFAIVLMILALITLLDTPKEQS